MSNLPAPQEPARQDWLSKLMWETEWLTYYAGLLSEAKDGNGPDMQTTLGQFRERLDVLHHYLDAVVQSNAALRQQRDEALRKVQDAYLRGLLTQEEERLGHTWAEFGVAEQFSLGWLRDLLAAAGEQDAADKVAWVEQGVAPKQWIATRPDRSRPLCPWPQTARYKGSGSTDDAANFECR